MGWRDEEGNWCMTEAERLDVCRALNPQPNEPVVSLTDAYNHVHDYGDGY